MEQFESGSVSGIFDFANVAAVLGGVWYRAFLGAGLLLVACAVGWGIGEHRSLAPVRMVRWWTSRVVRRVLTARSWLVRCALIFLNNILILALLLALWRWSWLVIAGTILVGVVMGVAIHCLSDFGEFLSSDESTEQLLRSPRAKTGMLLNLLEPPAIAVCLGLGLSAQPDGLSLEQVWGTFVCFVMPLMLLAAGGESLWLGALSGKKTLDATPRPEEGDS